MATTFPEGTTNSFEEVTVMFTDMLDEVYAQNAKTTAWTPNPKLVQGFKNSKYGKIATLSTSGLGDYSDKGYPLGNASTKFEQYELQYDRAVAFPLHNVNLMQTGNIGVASAVLAEFARTQEIPEIDACRIAKVATACGTLADHHKDYAPDRKTIVKTITDALQVILDDTGLDSGINILFNAKYASILYGSEEFTRTKNIESSVGSISNIVGSVNGNPVTMVPSKRMFNSIATKAGTSPSDFGFDKGPGAKEVVALFTAPGTAQGITAHQVTQIVPQSERFDGSLINFHIYHDCIVPKNKIPGCYVLENAIAPRSTEAQEVADTAKATPKSSKK